MLSVLLPGDGKLGPAGPPICRGLVCATPTPHPRLTVPLCGWISAGEASQGSDDVPREAQAASGRLPSFWAPRVVAALRGAHFPSHEFSARRRTRCSAPPSADGPSIPTMPPFRSLIQGELGARVLPKNGFPPPAHGWPRAGPAQQNEENPSAPAGFVETASSEFIVLLRQTHTHRSTGARAPHGAGPLARGRSPSSEPALLCGALCPSDPVSPWHAAPWLPGTWSA